MALFTTICCIDIVKKRPLKTRPRTRRPWPSLAVILLLFLLSAPISHAADNGEAVSFVSYYIPLLVEDEEHGTFPRLLKEATKRADIEYTLELYPTRRAMRMFEEGEVMAILPALLSTLAKDAALTETIFTKDIHAFVRKGTPIPHTVQELEDRRVGLVRGFSYPRSILFNERIVIDYADTTDSSLMKLEEGRVDIVVVDGHTAVHAIPRLGLKSLDYDLSITLHSQPAYIAFQPTEEGRALAARLSEAIRSMKEDGAYDALMPRTLERD